MDNIASPQPSLALKPKHAHALPLCSAIFAAIFTSGACADEEQSAVLTPVTTVAEQALKPFKSGNMDLVRSADDAQAYTLIDRDAIERTGATTMSELIAKVLPMATSTNTSSYFSATSSQINLRGLGTNQTLVLINGRRSAGTGNRGNAETTQQPNLNNIPLAAIERVEILPTSAAAIYGSGAVGGVINVIMRKDYQGSEIDLRYANTTDHKQPVKSLNLVSGFSLESGRTNIMLTAYKKDQDDLQNKERDFALNAREKTLQNNADSIYGMNSNGTAKNPPAGNLTNIRSKDGSELFAGWGDSIAHIPQNWNGDINQLGKGYALDFGTGVSSFSGEQPILYNTDTEAFGISINRSFTERLNLFLEANYEKEEGWGWNDGPHGYRVVTVSKTHPNNPFNKDILVNYPMHVDSFGGWKKDSFETTQQKIATGFTYDLPREWVLSADYSWSFSDIRQRYIRKGSKNPKAEQWNADLANNAINFLTDMTTTPSDIVQKYWHYTKNNTQQTLNDISLRATGPIAQWYAGKINLATGIEHRIYESEGYADHQYVDNPWVKGTERETAASSVYAELNVPLVSPSQELAFVELLEVQLATRYENFSLSSKTPVYTQDPISRYNSVLSSWKDAGTAHFDAITPTFGLKYVINNQVMLRASYSEGFVTPTPSQLALPSIAANTSTGSAALKDPITNKTLDNSTDIISGGNPDITPEKSTSYNLGIVLTPKLIDRLRLSVDYYQIKKTNNITSISAQYILDNQGLYGDRVKRDANGDVVSIDTAAFNALSLKTSGIDSSLGYDFDSFIGNTSFSIGHTYVKEYLKQDSLITPEKDFVGEGSSSNPLKHRGNASMRIAPNEIWSIGWAMQYYDSYKITSSGAILNQTGTTNPEMTIAAQTYHDLMAKINLPFMSKGGYLDNAAISLGVNNLFDSYRVDMSGQQGYLSYYSDVRGRNYYLNMEAAF